MDCEYVFDEKIQNLNDLVSNDLLGGGSSQQQQHYHNNYHHQQTNHHQVHPTMEEQIHHLRKSYSDINDLCDALTDLNFQAKERQEQVKRDLQFATEHHASQLISLGTDVLSQVISYMDEDGLSKCEQASRTLKEKVITQEHWQYLADLSQQQQNSSLFPLSDQPDIRRQQECMHQWLLQARQNQRAASH